MKINLAKYFGDTGGIVVLLALALLFIIFGPWFVIWSINVLAPAAAIPFNFETWCAVVLLHAFLRSAIATK